MATSQHQLEWRGQKVVDPSGSKVGTLDEIYFDADTDRPEWAAVKTGMFGSHLSFVPLAGASSDGDEVRVAYEKAQIKDAPHADADEQLSSDDEDRLYRHYGVGGSEPSGEGRAPVGRDVSGPTTDEAMTRSEEELDVSTSRRTAGTARLRKFVDTENVSQTVSLERESARVTREPITGANRDAAMDGPEISTEEHEVTLTSEEPVVEKRTVAKEQVGMGKETVTEDREVSEDLRKERIDVEGDVRR
jgi:uncharacterized protein (TIGR02271 family)